MVVYFCRRQLLATEGHTKVLQGEKDKEKPQSRWQASSVGRRRYPEGAQEARTQARIEAQTSAAEAVAHANPER